MDLTKTQRNFFADLDLNKAIAAGEGKVNITFTHKASTITVEAHSTCDADIIVRRAAKVGVASYPDTRLSLFNIPNTMNVSAEKVLRMVYEEASTHVASKIKQAWLDTSYVERWHVSVLDSCTEFSTNTGETKYLIEVTESPDDDSATVAELFRSGDSICTFTIQQPYNSDHTAQSLLNLAEAITEAWRDAALEA